MVLFSFIVRLKYDFFLMIIYSFQHFIYKFLWYDEMNLTKIYFVFKWFKKNACIVYSVLKISGNKRKWIIFSTVRQLKIRHCNVIPILNINSLKYSSITHELPKAWFTRTKYADVEVTIV